MIISYLYSLGFSVIFTANTANYCLKPLNGCFLPETKQIVVSVNSPHFKSTFWHEASHALTDGNKKLEEFCANHELVKRYQKAAYPVNEMMADMMMRYLNNSQGLKKDHPDIYKIIDKQYGSEVSRIILHAE